MKTLFTNEEIEHEKPLFPEWVLNSVKEMQIVLNAWRRTVVLEIAPLQPRED